MMIKRGLLLFCLASWLIATLDPVNAKQTSPNSNAEWTDNLADDDLRFELGIQFYEDARYDSAAYYFRDINTPEGRLFAGKSYWATGNYLLSGYFLQKLSRNEDPRLFDEAQYTLALVYFQTHQFGNSLDLLQNLLTRPSRHQLRSEVRSLYNQILAYLTIEQRKQAFLQSNLVPVQLDIIRYGLDFMTQTEAQLLIDALRPYFNETIDDNVLASLERRIPRLPENHDGLRSYGNAPDGTIYDIGVILPQAERGTSAWQVSRSLYHGYLIAAENYNKNTTDRKVRLRLLETSDSLLTDEAAMARFAWDYHVDAILGPLFSNAAYRIAELAEYYQIPVIPPLANADTLNINNPYLYQVNPTFEARGRAMARFAVEELNLDTLAVITQSNHPVSREAREFRIEAERLGATVLHYFSENFERRAFNVSHITPWFAGHERFIDTEKYSIKPVKGLYLALTGSGAEHLIELIINDLQATRSNVTILSNQTIAQANISSTAKRSFDIYYSDFFHLKPENRYTYLFRDEFRNLTDIAPDDYAYLGFDVGTFLFETLDRVQNPTRLKNHLRLQPHYDGTISRIDFQGFHVNQYLNILHMSRDETRLYERATD